ncbi:MAG: peptidoglycan DD-metalloendopeptidase family protein [Oxalobacter formigenes]|nr:peptidoglycan DD-metalloendopeptidase family protein [Oxalobacter formigenes]
MKPSRKACRPLSCLPVTANKTGHGFFACLFALFLPVIFASLPAAAQQAKKGTAKPQAAASKSAKSTSSKTAKPAAKKTAKPADSTRQKQAAETERGKVREQLSNLKKEIGKTETEKGKAADTLAQSEEAIKNTNRTIQELEKKQSSTVARLDRLTAEQSRLETTIAQQQEKLASLLQNQYISGNEDRMKLLLSGDNPNRIIRELQYMTYLSEAQAELTLSLRANLNAVDNKRVQTASAKQELEKISREKLTQKQKLEKEKAGHAVLLAQLSSRLEQQRKQAEKLQQDEKRLSALVDTLAKKIAEQRKAAAARKAAEARKRAQKTGKKPQQVEAVADAESAKSTFAKQRGRMKLPVRGTITAHYGSRRADGPSWKGIFIQSPHGAEIRCVANGEVVFADWLRGFGNLIIVDHGAQYMTIYANAQTLKRKVGDNVKGGDVIASVGNSSDNTQTGLYFEMRRNGQAFDPMGWVTTR